MSPEYVLARLSPRPIAWNFYSTLEAAEAAAPEINARETRHGAAPYTPMTFDAFLDAERAHYLTGKLVEITAEKWDEMLNILPPLHWERRDGVERFCMCEMLCGTFTEQFAQQGNRFFMRTVDVRDRSTWITGAEVAKHISEETQAV